MLELIFRLRTLLDLLQPASKIHISAIETIVAVHLHGRALEIEVGHLRRALYVKSIQRAAIASLRRHDSRKALDRAEIGMGIVERSGHGRVASLLGMPWPELTRRIDLAGRYRIRECDEKRRRIFKGEGVQNETVDHEIARDVAGIPGQRFEQRVSRDHLIDHQNKVNFLADPDSG
jgi:hypothetical protein